MVDLAAITQHFTVLRDVEAALDVIVVDNVQRPPAPADSGTPPRKTCFTTKRVALGPEKPKASPSLPHRCGITEGAANS
jgi:hypothetical protein